MPVRSRRLFLTALFAVSLLSGCALKKAAEGSQTTSQKTAKPLQRKPSVQSGKTAERPQPQKPSAAAKERSFVPVFLPVQSSFLTLSADFRRTFYISAGGCASVFLPKIGRAHV